ncbi:HEAT repeat domain-containing protein [Ornithinimicrobium pratense]|uniref:HEAT repeat domain-containing protein n=1 Tax=Ornithinimicrobium pratense TaxID=2593973 RepID=A0A5J6V820_9MICO|nr:HEAT repeat domain-containing protein [Ornithinimicrobium pratense]QFG69928.1 HEAT repeat domain-containing protein [Ornithinimicrobium pratense]
MSAETPLQQALRAALSPDLLARQWGALRLGTLADASVAGDLVALLVSESDPFVRETLTWAVVRQAPATVPHLLAALAGQDESRGQVLHALAKIQDPQSVQHALPLVHDPHPVVAAKAWWMVGRTAVPETAPVLLGLLGQQQDEEQRRALTRALAQMGEVAVPGLAEALGAEHPEVRRHAAEVLVAVGDPAVGALDALLAVAQGEDRELVMLALEALGPLGAPEVDEVLLRLRDGHSRWLATVADWLINDRAERRARQRTRAERR